LRHCFSIFTTKEREAKRAKEIERQRERQGGSKGKREAKEGRLARQAA